MKFRILVSSLIILLVYGCSTTQQTLQKALSLPVPVDTVNFATLEQPPENWYRLDEERTQFRGISAKLAYATLLNDQEPKQKVIVAVIDGGVDINHEDLNDNIWTNKDEIPDNGKDDDNNGYVDDIHGWNFIGGPKGKNVGNDTFELTRIYSRLHDKFENADTAAFNSEERQGYKYYLDIKGDYRYQIEKYAGLYKNILNLERSIQQADKVLREQYHGDYSYEDLKNLETATRKLAFAKNVMSYAMENEIDSALIAEQKKQIYEFAKYGYNPNFNPRHIVGDDYADKTELFYGNNDVAGPDPMHGTHVAGIIAAERNNGIGMNGIANNVLIMAIRVVPNGDERDKDVANGIRYAVNNGADIINMSFGKSYSPHKWIVDKAIKYADEHGVLMVHASGNSSENIDVKPNYPTDQLSKAEDSPSIDLWLEVGATGWKPGKGFVADFSNYGNQDVDVFAPGESIYSTVPNGEYKRLQGTSMAAPVVSGVAALLMSYYPDLSAAQIKEIIMKSAVEYPNLRITVPHKADMEATTAPFSDLSVSDGVVNVYEAVKLAEKMTK